MAWTLGNTPFAADQRHRLAVRAEPGEPRSPLRRAWSWFDGLSDLQTACCLSAVLLVLGVTSLLLLARSAALVASSPPPTVVAAAGNPRPPAQVASIPTPAPPGWTRAHTVSPLGVNLRAGATISAPTLATLPVDTEVLLLGETAISDNATWQHVRTLDGREGWIIDTALE
jgi:hypothetical protein